MKSKSFGVYCASVIAVISIALMGASHLNAQTSVNQPAEGLNAPASAVSFSPSVATGLRSYMSGSFSNNSSANTVGPYVTPALELSYKNPSVTTTLTYGAEITSARGYGGGLTGDDRTFSNNTYIEHNPNLVISGGVSENWKINTMADLVIHTDTTQTSETVYKLTFTPDVEFKLNPSLSISAGYLLYRESNFDSSVQSPVAAGEGAADKPTFAAVAPTANGETPYKQLHAGIVTAKAKLSDEVKLTTYARAGKLSSNVADKAGYAYRLNADLSTPTPINDLSAQIRYRLNVEDIKGADINYYNMGRLILAYELSTVWSLDLQNTFVVSQKTTKTSKAAYENESYLGGTFKF